MAHVSLFMLMPYKSLCVGLVGGTVLAPFGCLFGTFWAPLGRLSGAFYVPLRLFIAFSPFIRPSWQLLSCRSIDVASGVLDVIAVYSISTSQSIL